MRINPVCNVRYANYQTKSKAVKGTSEVPAAETVNQSFKGKPLTKLCGGIGGITAAIAIIGTGGAAAVILPALGFAATCTGVGYAMDKDNEKDEKKNQ